MPTFSLASKVPYMEYIKPILMTQATFMPSWTFLTHHLLYPKDTYHNDRFHLTILTKCLDFLSIQTHGVPKHQISLGFIEMDKHRMVHASNHCHSCTKIDQHPISKHAVFTMNDVTIFHYTCSISLTKNNVVTPT